MKNKYRMLTKIVRNLNLKKKQNGNEFNDNEMETLRYISKHPFCISNDIVNYLYVDKALVTRITHKLEINHYITIHLGDDKRKKHLEITQKGLDFKVNDHAFETAYYKTILKDLSNEEIDQFFTILEKVYNNSKTLRKSNEKKI